MPRPALLPACARAAACACALLLVAASAAPAKITLRTFKSPSGNIGCAIDRGFARCDVRQHTWHAPPKPQRCKLDWGDGAWVMTRGRGGIVCAGDTTQSPNARALGYGRSIGVGRFTCTSREAGMTCRNRRTSHGFTVSRTSYRLF